VNFLAHMHLAGPDADAVVGNVIADLIRGPDLSALPPAVQAGVRVHRRVDGFTDSHPVVQRSIGRISAKWGWFSGIILDITYDHYLATEWADYCAEPYAEFCARMYDTLEAAKPLVNDEGKFFLTKFRESDRLARYATVGGLAETLELVSRRVAARIPKRALPLHEAMPDLLAADAELRADFRAFYPELVRFAAGLRAAT
jgi:acyl carrier protein phosphodiesterase